MPECVLRSYPSAYPLRNHRPFTALIGFTPGTGGSLQHDGFHIAQQHIARQRGFAGAADAGHGNQAMQGNLYIEVLKIVQAGARDSEPLRCRLLMSLYRT